MAQPTQYIFIQSKYRSHGTPYDYTVTIPDNIITSVNNDDEMLCLTIQSFSTYHSWYMVNDNYNTIKLKNNVSQVETTIHIENGNYSYKNLSRYINDIYEDGTVEYNPSTNRFEFTFSQSHTLYFLDKSYSILGFNVGEEPTGTSFTSTNVLKARQSDHICMNILDLHQVYPNADNIGGVIKLSNMVMYLPIVSAPFDLITYENKNDEFSYYVRGNKLNKIHIRVTDLDGETLDYIPEHEFVLRVEVVKTSESTNDVNKALADMNQTLQMILLSLNLGSSS